MKHAATLLLCSAFLLTGCAGRKPPAMPSFPPPPASATEPCAWPALPVPLTAEALEIWFRDDARADAACEAKRAALVKGWPR